MTRCIIHIGMHKTGSTSIQGSLRGYRDGRFVYATLGKTENHSVPVCSLFSAHPERLSPHRASDAAGIADYLSGVRADLDRAIEMAQGRTLIISGEGISARLRRRDLVGMREYFAKSFDTITIAAYVRPPAAYMASAFQQRLKAGAVRFSLVREYPGYRKTFVKFDKVFGRENVRLWKFEPGSLRGGCAVQDFCARLDIALPQARIVRVNDSLSRQTVALLYIYRKLGDRYGAGTMKWPERQKLCNALAALDRNKFRFSADAVRPVLQSRQRDIAWMEERLGQSLHEELGEDQPGDVRDEADLLCTDPETIARLLELLAGSVPRGVRGGTPEEVALLVHALRLRNLSATQGKPDHLLAH